MLWKFISTKYTSKGWVQIYYNDKEKLFSVWLESKGRKGLTKVFESPFHSACKKHRDMIL